MKVVPTGAVFYAVCNIKSENCKAKEGGAVTTVLLADSYEQVNTCKVCLNQKLRSGEWNVEGSRVSNMREVLDLAVVDPQGRVLVAVEIKINSSRHKKREKHILEQMSSKSSLRDVQYFVFATPDLILVCERNSDDPHANLHKLVRLSPKLSDPNFENLRQGETSSPLMKSKRHMLLERSFSKYFKTNTFTNELPNNIKNIFDSNEIVMEYVVKNT